MFSIDQINTLVKGKIICGSKFKKITGVSIDSRTIKKGDIYIAIKGERFDGHRFVKSAIQKGASAVLVSRKKTIFKNVPHIYVKDTIHSLGEIASFHRNCFQIPVIAVSGSSGKTTTKEMISSILSVRFKVLKNAKTENNYIGVPLTLLKLKSSHQAAVIEIGTNQTGEINYLSKMVAPTVAVLTNIGESHLLGLKNVRGVFREKYNLVRNCKSDGTIIFNHDDPYLKRIKKCDLKQRKITFGLQAGANFRAQQIEFKNKSYKFRVKNKLYQLYSPAEHNVLNALAAICVGSLYNINYNNINKNLNIFKQLNGRQEIHRFENVLVINDTYNSNPVSFKSAIKTLETIPTKGSRILVCADMLELGSKSRILHQKIGQSISRTLIDFVVTRGSDSRWINGGRNKYLKRPQYFHCRSENQINQKLKQICHKGDLVLVKGSRAMEMEKVVDFLKTF